MHRPAAVLAAAGLLGAQAIHTAVLPGHWAHSRPEGAFFLVLGLLEGGVAAGLLAAPSRRVAGLAIALSLATIVVWAWTRTVGVPLGPAAGEAEPVGRADAVATLLEAATAAAALRLVLAARTRRHTTALPVVAAVGALTAFGLLAADDHRQPHGHPGGEAAAPATITSVPR